MEFERLELLIGLDKLNSLKDKTILILGVGGVGGYVVEALARCSIGHLVLVDFDKVDITNINRQIIATHLTIGQKKVDCFKKRILEINPLCIVDVYDFFYDDNCKDIIFKQKIDYIVDCCDSLNSKALIIREAIQRSIPIVSSMGTGNKFHPECLKLAKLKDTSYDPLARKLRNLLRNDKACLDTMVAYSTEVPVKGLGQIASIVYLPSVAGLLLASYVVNSFLEGDKKK